MRFLLDGAGRLLVLFVVFSLLGALILTACGQSSLSLNLDGQSGGDGGGNSGGGTNSNLLVVIIVLILVVALASRT